ncbi:MAG: dipeptidase [Treponema sp.]|jgi:membrane dipeptidase|nr:dipeptidase [Treponema sp.]
MTKVPVVDLHCDTATEILRGRSLYENDGMVSIAKMREGGVFCQFFAMFIHMSVYESKEAAFLRLGKLHRGLTGELEKYPEHIALAHNAAEIAANRKEGKISAILTVEEGGVLDNKIERLDEFYEMGVRLITLTWNFENCLGFPRSLEPDAMGRSLKPFGLEVVRRMQELGMIVDVSHLSDGGFWDVAKLAAGKKPFVASHSNARSVHGHPRNLTDDMLKALADAGGITGVNFFSNFLGGEGKGTVEQIIRHIKHIHKVAGIDAIAIGSDFDGFDDPNEIPDSSKFDLLTGALSNANYSEAEIEKICWKNAMRVIEETL